MNWQHKLPRELVFDLDFTLGPVLTQQDIVRQGAVCSVRDSVWRVIPNHMFRHIENTFFRDVADTVRVRAEKEIN